MYFPHHHIYYRRAMSSNAAAEQSRARRRHRRIRMQRIAAANSDALPPPPSNDEEEEENRSEPPAINPSPPVCAAPLAGVKAVIGLRRKMEDAVSVWPNLCSPMINRRLPVHYFAVFDGHGGSHFSNICMEKMHQILQEELMGVPAPGESQIEPPGYISEESALHEAWRLLMNRVFSRTEKAALGTCECGSEGFNCNCNFNRGLLSDMGTTVVALVVTEKHLVVGNCGDSRAVLYRSGRPIPLSSDHKPMRADEKARVEACGGRLYKYNRDIPRVQGILAMTRAIGDMSLKPYVISEAEVSLTRRGEHGEFVILASDGMWDVIPNDMAGRVAAQCLREPENEDGCSSAASLLMHLAVANGSSDNISVVVVDLSRKARAA